MSIISGGSTVLRGFSPFDDLNFTLVERPTITAPADTYGTAGDIATRLISGQLVDNNFRVGIQSVLGYTVDNLTPAIISLDADLNADLVTQGAAQVRITDELGQQRLITRQMVTTGLGSSIGPYFHGFRAGSLGAHITAAIQAMISGKTPGVATMAACSANNYSTVAPAVTRNAALFCGGLDLSAISVISGAGRETMPGIGYHFPGALISPRHVLGAWHAPHANPMVWQRQDGSYATASVLSRARIDGTDLAVAYLDAAVTGITPLKLLPADWASYLHATAAQPYAIKLPALSKTVHDTAGAVADRWNINHVVGIRHGVSTWGEIKHAPCWCTYQPTLGTEAWYSPIIGGDSGGPVLVPIDGEAVLLGTYYSTVTLPMAASWLPEIEAAMLALASAAGDQTAYAPATISLAGFTAF